MKKKFFCFSLIISFLLVSCGNGDETTLDPNQETKDETTLDRTFESIENNNNSISGVTDIDTSTKSGDTIDVDPVIYDINGNAVKLSDFKGKPVVLNVWASWCVPCQYELNDFQKSYEKYGEDVEFIMVDLVGVEEETISKAKGFILENDFTFPVYFDLSNELFYSLVITEIPTTIFINSDGTILNKEIGFINEDDINENIDQLIKNNKK